MDIINSYYQEIISTLQKGERPLIKLDQEKLEKIIEKGKQYLESKDEKKFQQILCILDNTQTLSHHFVPLLYNLWKFFILQIQLYSLSLPFRNK